MTTDVLSDTDVSLKVVSNASGRMRVCVTGFNVDAVRAVAIEETVSQVTGVHAVHALSANSVGGDLVLARAR